ncbi:butyrophilin subfamily 2 member A1-like isoform X2 [Mastacembelus armatus]|uniref:butyrophilin subfamily 2 member A1-like isoform X2 n=1 Tax=Mastacembelus armatus TaxID=205130 RepID=UPI000E45D167|nr:butyrophilin subfamily 2 member A1-like isoform X2 [Mastacembelus armatus]
MVCLRTLEYLVFICLLFWTGASGNNQGTGDVTVKVTVGDDAILPCSLSTRENIVQKLFHWRKDGQDVFLYDAGLTFSITSPHQDQQFKGRVFHFPDKLQSGNASIVIRNTKVTDSGNYSCDFPHLQTGRLIFKISLIVDLTLKDRSGQFPGAAPAPCCKILKVTEDGVVLQCEVQGASPKPDVKWQDGDGNVLRAEEPQVSERGGLYNVSLLTTVTKTSTNLFHCVSTQKDIGHRTEEEIYVPERLLEDKSCHEAPMFIGGWFSGVLTVSVPLAVLVAAKYIRKRRNKGSGHERNGSCNGESVKPLQDPEDVC